MSVPIQDLIPSGEVILWPGADSFYHGRRWGGSRLESPREGVPDPPHVTTLLSIKDKNLWSPLAQSTTVKLFCFL